MERIYKFIPREGKMTASEAYRALYEFNVVNGLTYGTCFVPRLSAVIVYKSSNWSEAYSLESRSYRVLNIGGKRFFPNMCGNSVYGDSLDGSDIDVRLDYYEWEVDYAYLEDVEVTEI